MSPSKRSGLDVWNLSIHVVVKVMRFDETIHGVDVEVEEISRLNVRSLSF